MKKVLSVALASAMVLGMGVNAFADISYNTGVSDKEVSLSKVGLQFDGGLVIERDGKFYTTAQLDETDEGSDFRPDDNVYMPLWGNNQVVYDNDYAPAKDGVPAVEKLRLDLDYSDLNNQKRPAIVGLTSVSGTQLYANGENFVGPTDVAYTGKVKYNDVDRDYSNVSVLRDASKKAIGIQLDLAAIPASEEHKDTTGNDVEYTQAYGPYTGEIGKNWSINFTEKSENYVEKASFYRAKSSDSSLLQKKAWYIKVELKDMFDSVDADEVYYKVYVADNNGDEKATTNKVYVKGTYDNKRVKYVDFEWTNPANEPAVWEVKKGENGTAVFDFQDKAFFTVKMYSQEKMYLDLSTAYQKAVAGEYDAEFDSFFKFQGTNANFSRTGELIIESNDANLFVYEIDADGNLYPVDAKYVKDYQITHTNDKINGYVFNTKTLGNYVLSVDELEVEEDAPATEVPEENNTSSDKENPNTGANDFVGVAVALAVVSVAGAGALALKK